ncbi:hypothetical protein COW38_00405 [Candidatus Collierbacteria bacterium CG17_big_fil_post_rev_8_21_14_2_50_45_7]|uniref:Uncharacterized protein n=1 Tax=Candidatus Collierbacteria bacterium CG17_big_fil_post_rev_8_21_14_2_50_45_7 TaxID=1974536 RepID=A0A2M7FRM6_9BACT|nr:MAG: hypothetical protein COW38_00405 [Candidatus Collierbacteria bacterium CG17_big_fil_post_rev_8_21_14_2_50_45_7]
MIFGELIVRSGQLSLITLLPKYLITLYCSMFLLLQQLFHIFLILLMTQLNPLVLIFNMLLMGQIMDLE